MNTRRSFLKAGILAGLLPTQMGISCASVAGVSPDGPVVISTWRLGLPANLAAWDVLARGGRALDAVEAGARVPELDPLERSVGFGGRPDQTGVVTLDASIMDEKGNCGSVAFLENIKNPISVARLVMEKTPHVMLVGDGAQEFALQNGFKREDLLTEESRKEWLDWQKQQEKPERPAINIENHDTIGILALDTQGNLSGACSTSGAAWKMHGRVGDSPIIGAGLYVDNEVGAAAATGWGEAVIRVVGSHLVVEFMRQGHAPDEACRLAVERVIKKNPDYRSIQVGFLALSRDGRFGGYAIQPGFEIAVCDGPGKNRVVPAKARIAGS